MIIAYRQSLLTLHTFVWVRYTYTHKNEIDILSDKTKEKKVGNRIIYLSSELQIKKDSEGNILTKYLKTTPGRILLNQSFE